MTGDRSSVTARARRAAPCLPACGMRSPSGTVRRHGGRRLHPSRRHRGALPSTPGCRRMNASCCTPRLAGAPLRACALEAGGRPGVGYLKRAPRRRTQQGLLRRSPRRPQPIEPCARVADLDGGHDPGVTTHEQHALRTSKLCISSER